MDAELLALPGVPRVRLARGAGRRARSIIALAGASDWRRAGLDRLAAQRLRLGTALLPTATRWAWPDQSVGEVESTLADALPGAELVGAVLPRQPDRHRLSALVDVGGRLVVVKLGRPGTGIERETEALRLLEGNPLPGIATPVVVAAGGSDDLVFIATEATDLRRQYAAIDEPLRTFEADLTERLSLLGRPTDSAPEHVPVHGDLTPWNLRRTPRGLALFDWEAAGWGPAGSDLALYRATCASLPRRTLRARATDQAFTASRPQR